MADDTIIAGLNGIDDVLAGDSGDDTVTGLSGADTLFGALGDDLLRGGAGKDTLYGDRASADGGDGGKGGDDVLDGGSGADVAFGDSGDDVLNGDSGADRLSGGTGEDRLHGGSGADLLEGGKNPDLVDGGSGIDTASYEHAFGGVTVDLHLGMATGADGTDRLLSIENANGSAFADHLVGSAGRNVLAGLNGNDTIRGGLGDDTLIGGGGSDKLYAGDGADRLSGGTGNDVFFVAGKGSVKIEDGGGNDTIDMSGAKGEAVFHLASGGTVGGRHISIVGAGKTVAPLDVVFAQDLTGSFSDDLANVRTLIPDIINAIDGFQPNARFGVASFKDKPVSPFGGSGDYVYETDVPLTTNGAAIQTAYNGFSSFGGNDTPEAQLEALQQLALRTTEVGWSAAATNVVVLFTDAAFHQKGDGAAAGITVPNNGDTVLDGSPPSTGEDYPSVAQVASELVHAGITPVFAVTSDVTSNYQDLVKSLGHGAVVPLASDSSNIVDAVHDALSSVFAPTLIENVVGTTFGDHIVGNRAGNTIDGRAGKDVISGGNGKDVLSGGGGDDKLSGGGGRDTLSGDHGTDRLTGGSGNDHFVFKATSDSGPGAGARDTITDFAVGHDRIDLHVIDANSHAGGNQHFTFIGAHAFSDKAGELRAVHSGHDTIVSGDVNGDGHADFAIELNHLLTLKAADFIL